MKQILVFNLKDLYQDESFGFLKMVQSAFTLLPQTTSEPELPEVQSLARSLSLKSARLQKVVEGYNTAFDNFDAVLKTSQKNPVTEKINAADEERDKAWVGSNGYINAMLKHPDSEFAAIAKSANDIFEKYGNPTRLSQTKETGVIHNLLEDLEGLTSLSTIYFDPWYNWMKTTQEAFEAATLERAKAKGAVQKGLGKEVREAAEEAYRTLVQAVNSIVFVEETDEYDEFIQAINAEIERQTAIIKRRETVRKNNKEEEEPSEEKPSTETPGTETPDTETPDTETPDTETPDTEEPDTETPSTGGEEEPDDRPVVQ